MTIWYLIFIYIILAFSGWYYVHLAHSRNGIWYKDEINAGYLLLIFIPFIQIIFNFGWIIAFPIEKSFSTKSLEKFFNIKK